MTIIRTSFVSTFQNSENQFIYFDCLHEIGYFVPIKIKLKFLLAMPDQLTGERRF